MACVFNEMWESVSAQRDPTETVTADGNCSFRRFGILLQDEGQNNVRTAEACIIMQIQKLYSSFPPIFCICEISHKYMPRKTRCVGGKIDCMVVMSK
jgi:hypothetical protein